MAEVYILSTSQHQQPPSPSAALTTKAHILHVTHCHIYAPNPYIYNPPNIQSVPSEIYISDKI